MSQVTSGKFKTYQAANAAIPAGLLSGTPTIKVALFLAASNANTLTTPTKFADVTHEVAASNGYTAGGVALKNVTIARATDKWQLKADSFDANDPLVTVSGGNIVFHYLVYYVVGTVGGVVNPLLGVALADASDKDVTILDGQKVTLTFPADGFLVGTGAYTD